MKNKLLQRLRAAWLQSDTPLVRWGIVVVGLILCWSLLVAPYLDWRQQRAELIRAHAQQAVKLRLLLASAPQWRQANQRAQQRLQQWLPRLFRNSSEAAAQADLVRLMLKTARKYHITLQSQRLLEPEQQGALRRIMAFMIFHGKRSDVLAFLDAAARLPQLVVLDRVDINRHAATGDTAIRCRVSGFRLVDAT